MAGGKGTRLRPLTCSLPKPMVPLLNKPCMSYIIELLHEHGIRDIAVTTQYMPEAITSYYDDGSSHGVNLHYFDETVPLGTAGSIKNAEAFLQERFVVISGDALTDIDLTEAVAFHEQSGSKVTIVLARVEQPLEFGVVQTGPDGRIARFIEKPDWSEVFSDTVNTGIYIIEPEVLGHIPQGQEYDFSKELFPTLMEAGVPLFGYITERYWSDIGSIEQYKQTQFDMLDGKVNVRLSGRQISPGVYAHEEAELHPAATIEGPAYIGAGASIGGGAVLGPYTIIGDSARIGGRSELGRSIVWHRAEVGDGVEMNGSLLCNHSIVGSGSRLRQQSVVGSHCRIGKKATLASEVHIWPDKEIRDEAHVHSSLIWGSTVTRRLFATWGVYGLAGIEMTPQFAARFALAYGSQYPVGSRLLLTCSDNNYCGVMQESLLAGLRTIGLDIVDGGITLPEAARAYVTEAGLDGSLHVQHSLEDARLGVRLECSDGAGLPIPKSLERKIESAYWHQDFRRVDPEQIGGRADVYVNDVYAERFTMAVDWSQHQPAASAQRAGSGTGGGLIGKVAIYAEPAVYSLAAALLGPGAERIVYAGTPGDANALSIFARTSDVCLVLDESGRGLQVLLPDGTKVEGDDMICLAMLAASHHGVKRTIALPVDAPAVAESIAEGLGFTVLRTKHDPRSILQASEAPLFHPLYSGLYAAAMLMLHMAGSGQKPEEMLAAIPQQYRRRQWIDCPWERKGAIFRQLAERDGSSRRQVEWSGGLRFHQEDGSILVLHEANAPQLQLIVESDSADKADAIIGQYQEEIAQYLI
nr:sugar phosphate nucleotidyltransferase [Paenibacillus phyllosphaerae]